MLLPRHLSTYFFACTLLLLQFFFSGQARAGGVVVCDNCVNPRQAAIGSGSGTTIVVDFAQLKLYGYDVEYDREFRRYRAITTPIPAPVTDAFNRIMALAEGPLQPDLRPMQSSGGNGAVFPIHPDNPGFTNGVSFPEEFKGINAYDVVMSATTRARLEEQIGAAFSGSSTGSTIWNSLSTTLSSLGLSMISRLFGVESVTYVITWRDGSKSVLVIHPDSVNSAKYKPGESRDAAGNRIPDTAAADESSGGDYGGYYDFTDAQSLQNWLDAARLYGIFVERGNAVANQIICRWDGKTLRCELPR